MKKDSSFGIFINDKIKKIIEDAVKKEKNKSAFAKKIGVSLSTVCYWLGIRKNVHNKGLLIGWENVRRLRDFIIENKITDLVGIEWMLPSEMAEEILELRGKLGIR